jgi:hypothetical protein
MTCEVCSGLGSERASEKKRELLKFPAIVPVWKLSVQFTFQFPPITHCLPDSSEKRSMREAAREEEAKNQLNALSDDHHVSRGRRESV